MISKCDKIVVGLSGGADSTTLLYVLNKLRESVDFDIVAAHLNHGIRGEEAERDMNFSMAFSKKLGIEFHSKKVNVPLYAQDNNISEETAGRQLRYEFFKEICKECGCNKIAVAHNKNDRAETIIMNLIRGCGANGLEGIKAVNDSVIRPLINVSREEIEEYTVLNNIDYVTDSTNREDIYTRNLVRNKIFGYMKDINPNAINNIIRTSDIITEENSYIDTKCIESCPMYIESDLELYILKANFINLSITEKRRIILSAIEKLNKSVDNITYSQIINALKTQSTGKEISFSNGVVLTYTSDRIIFSKSKNYTLEYNYKLNLNQPLYVKETNTTYLLTFVKQFTKEKNSVYIVADNIDTQNLEIRTRKDGDIFHPSGLKGQSKKVKKFFIDSKIPADKRNNYPLLVCNNEILAILPLRVSEKYTVSKDTEKIIKISIL